MHIDGARTALGARWRSIAAAWVCMRAEVAELRDAAIDLPELLIAPAVPPRSTSTHGFSLIETLIALGLVAGVSAALLPAVALASRLQHDSAIETEAAIVAAGRLEQLKAQVASGAAGVGGDLDAARDGWQEFVDRAGRPAPLTRASFDSRWRVTSVPAPAGVYLLTVRVVPIANAGSTITISAAVPDG